MLWYEKHVTPAQNLGERVFKFLSKGKTNWSKIDRLTRKQKPHEASDI